jgi:DNA polymerase-3 subunit delta
MTSAKPVYALVGEDSFLQLQNLAVIARLLPADAARIEFDGERAELADVLDELRSFAMFGGGKLVVVRNGDEFITRYREQLEDYIAEASSSATLVLRVATLPKNQRIYKAIDKHGQVVQCEPPRERDLPAWIQRQARDVHKINLSSDAANLLADLIGADLGRLDNELAKLALSCDDKKLIDVSDIGGCIAFQREQEMWHMTDALSAGDIAEALRRWRHLVQLDPSAEFRAVTWLTMWLENVRKAIAMRRKRVPDGVILKACRVFDFKLAGPFFRTVERLGDDGVARAVNLLAEVDQQTKTGVGDAATNVERFILSLSAT